MSSNKSSNHSPLGNPEELSETVVLSSGASLILMPSPGTHVAHVAVMVFTGTRDESHSTAGISHFIEHMSFKGTSTRKAFYILNRIDSIGGEINAYTTKELTCYYASVPAIYTQRALDLLLDIVLNSTFPGDEIEKEKNVISEEIDMYQDYPEETIFEDFEEKLFPKQAIGNPILGTKKTIQQFTPEVLTEHHTKWYHAQNIGIGISADISASTLLSWTETFWDKYAKPKLPRPSKRKKITLVDKAFHEVVKKSVQQSHVMLGGIGPARSTDEYFPMILLINYLGGPAMNARLNWVVREKHGLVYQISSSLQAYQDASFLNVYFSCDAAHKGKVMSLLQKECEILLNSGLKASNLEKVKKQYTGNLILQRDHRMNLLLQHVKESFLPDSLSLDAFTQKILSITPAETLLAAQKYLNTKQWSSIVYLPEKES
jgi:predicted Zn-dependent peptidase